MAYSYTDSGPKGPGDTLTVGFPFDLRDHVSVLVDGVVVAGSRWAWVNDGLISCLAGFPTGTLTRVQRRTPDDDLKGVLVGTAALDYPMVNSNFYRMLYVLQEKADQENDRETRLVEMETKFDNLDGSVLLGQRWAAEAEDVVVAGGEFSSKHYSRKSKAEKDAAAAAKDTSVSAKSASESARDLSQKWASEPEDSVVSEGLFSARHYAAKAATSLASIISGFAGAIHGAVAKASPEDADEFGYSDSASGWGLKKLTWAHIKSGIVGHFNSTPDAAPLDDDRVWYGDSANGFTPLYGTWATIKAFLKTYFDGIYNAKLGYTPVQQGGGPGQGTSQINIGWDGSSRVKVSVDGSDQGNVMFDGHLPWINAAQPFGGLGTVALVSLATGSFTAGGTFAGSSVVASGLHINASNQPVIATVAPALTGTWRALATTGAPGGSNRNMTLAVRIA